MHFEIRSALQIGRQLTPRQRKSGFSEAPTVAGKVLRRGVTIKLTQEQMEISKNQIKMLLDSESIIVEQVGSEDVPGSETGDEGTALDGGDGAARESTAEAGSGEEETRHDLRADIKADLNPLVSTVTDDIKVDDDVTIKLTEKG